VERTGAQGVGEVVGAGEVHLVGATGEPEAADRHRGVEPGVAPQPLDGPAAGDGGDDAVGQCPLPAEDDDELGVEPVDLPDDGAGHGPAGRDEEEGPAAQRRPGEGVGEGVGPGEVDPRGPGREGALRHRQRRRHPVAAGVVEEVAGVDGRRRRCEREQPGGGGDQRRHRHQDGSRAASP
jgi:hypothetical protein